MSQDFTSIVPAPKESFESSLAFPPFAATFARRARYWKKLLGNFRHIHYSLKQTTHEPRVRNIIFYEFHIKLSRPESRVPVRPKSVSRVPINYLSVVQSENTKSIYRVDHRLTRFISRLVNESIFFYRGFKYLFFISSDSFRYLTANRSMKRTVTLFPKSSPLSSFEKVSTINKFRSLRISWMLNFWKPLG